MQHRTNSIRVGTKYISSVYRVFHVGAYCNTPLQCDLQHRTNSIRVGTKYISSVYCVSHVGAKYF
ncbi:hypothetical protein [Capnocytophaga stomatis]|uniref:Uncharacterized protein n=1 Tax=Capnocytophaga stomatis TaxID=1848904 RepID=A0ABW8QBR2_9FLAO|nr:hypothetical protein [Capnocytophaga stomatis]